MAYTVAFVDSITAAPATRLLLSGGAWTVVAEGTDFAPPPLRRAVVSTLLADGSLIPAAAYENRTIRLRLLCTQTSEDDCAAAVQALARQLDRPGNVLLHQPATTQPVFFRTLRADFKAISWDPYTKVADVQIPADPFGYGLKQTLSPIVVNVNPASSNGCFFDVSGVLGDVETPLILTLPFSATGSAQRRTSVFAVRRRGTVGNLPLLRQAEALTQGTDTTTQANDAAFSGAGNNFSRCTFGTVAMATRVSGLMTAASASNDLRGTYRVFARVRHTVSTDVVKMRLVWGQSGFTLTANPEVTLLSGASVNFADLHHYDLGLVQVPVGADPVTDGYSGVEMPATAPLLIVQAQRVSGTGNLDIDYVLFVPADDKLLLVRWPSAGQFQTVLDGSHEMTYDADVGATMALGVTEPSELSGGFPMLSPGVTNRVVFLRDAAARDLATDAISGSTSVTPSYYPRYLYVRPVAS